jgi:SAM-dependent methyltransferase
MEEWRKYLTQKQSDDKYNELLSGGPKMRLFESFIDFGLAPLLSQGPMSTDEIAQKLALHPLRTRKWLWLLCLAGLIKKTDIGGGAAHGSDVYSITPFVQSIFGEDGKGGDFYKDQFHFVRAVHDLDFNAVLRGLPLPETVRWPPQTLEAAAHLEWWMSVTAALVIEEIEKTVDFSQISNLLDAAGGDGTMACEFVRRHPNLNVTLFNLPNSAYLARTNVVERGLTDRITIFEYDFLSEQPLPGGFDTILWSRVLSDWPKDVVSKLLKKTYDALLPGGQVVICEPFIDDNRNLVMAWEFRYLFYDDFGVAVYKSQADYEQLITGQGFTISKIHKADDDSIYSTLVARHP